MLTACRVETRGVPVAFSRATIDKFEDASASIVLRQIDRAFTGFGLSDDPGGVLGDRRVRFRQYVASIDQSDAEQRARLGAAFGALVDAAASSKEAFLVAAAESDGFAYVDGAFRARAHRAPSEHDEIASLDECGKHLLLLANEEPDRAMAEATTALVSICRDSLRRIGKEAPDEILAVDDMVRVTLDALADTPTGATLVTVLLASARSPVGGATKEARFVVRTTMAVALYVAECTDERLRALGTSR